MLAGGGPVHAVLPGEVPAHVRSGVDGDGVRRASAQRGVQPLDAVVGRQVRLNRLDRDTPSAEGGCRGGNDRVFGRHHEVKARLTEHAGQPLTDALPARTTRVASG